MNIKNKLPPLNNKIISFQFCWENLAPCRPSVHKFPLWIAKTSFLVPSIVQNIPKSKWKYLLILNVGRYFHQLLISLLEIWKIGLMHCWHATDNISEHVWTSNKIYIFWHTLKKLFSTPFNSLVPPYPPYRGAYHPYRRAYNPYRGVGGGGGGVIETRLIWPIFVSLPYL